MLNRLRHPVIWLPVSFALLALVVWRSRLWEAGAVLGQVDLRFAAAALVIGQLTPILWARRSHDLLAAAGHRVRVRSLIPMTSLANTINNLTPGSAGELVRLYLLRAHHAIDYRTSGAVILIERFVSLGYLSASGLLLWLAWSRGWSPVLTLVLLAALVVAPGVVYTLGLRPLSIVARLPAGALLGTERWGRWQETLRQVDATIGALLIHPRGLLAFAAATAGVFAVSSTQLLLLAASVGVELDPAAAWGALALATTAGVLSFLPFGLGATDLVLVALLGAAGVPAVEAAIMTFGYRLVATVPYALEGVAAYAWLSARLPAGGLGGAARAGSVGLDGRPLDGRPLDGPA